MRKQLLKTDSATAATVPGELDVATIASVAVTSEAVDHPVENAFDHRRGPGGSRWIAATPGEQTLMLAFDAPEAIRQVSLEVEETQSSRTQELHLAVSRDGGITYRELLRQEFTFSPPARRSSTRSGLSRPTQSPICDSASNRTRAGDNAWPA